MSKFSYYHYFLLLLLVITGCQKDLEIEDFPEPVQNNVSIERVPFSNLTDLPSLKTLISGNPNFYSEKSYSKSGLTDQEYLIVTTEIAKAAYLNYEAYTFRVENPEQPFLTFDNYVIQSHHNGNIEEFILRYEYDQREFLENKKRKILSVTKFDIEYNFISSSKEDEKKYNKSSGDCVVTVQVLHKIPDGTEREYVYEEGSVCNHNYECEVIIEYTMTCDSPMGGGGSPTTGGEDGDPVDGSNPPPGNVSPPDDGGPSEPITTLEPPLPQEGNEQTIENLTNIIDEPLSIFPSEGNLNEKFSALIVYLDQQNSSVFEDLNKVLINNLYDGNLDLNDKQVLWSKARNIYEIVKAKNSTIPSHINFDSFFLNLSSSEKESYTKNSMEMALFSSVKSVANEFWPKNEQEWGTLFDLMSPMLLEIGIEFLPGGGVFNSGNQALAGVNTGDYSAAVIGVVGIIMEFVPWAKVAKVASKVYTIGKNVFKTFKLVNNFLAEVASAMETGLKAVLDGNAVKLLDESGSTAGRITDNILTFRYSGFGGDIVTVPNKTTTVIGKYNANGVGTKNIIDSGLSKSGENIGGINALNEIPNANWDDNEVWIFINEPWLRNAANRGDIIRVVSDPTLPSNIYKPDGNLSFFGREHQFLTTPVTEGGLGYTYNPTKFVYTK